MPKTLARCAAIALAIGSVSTTVAEAAPTTIADTSVQAIKALGTQGQMDQFILSRRGADDPAGDDRGGRRGRGRDDGPNHAANPVLKTFDMARRGRGRDDGPNHT